MEHSLLETTMKQLEIYRFAHVKSIKQQLIATIAATYLKPCFDYIPAKKYILTFVQFCPLLHVDSSFCQQNIIL